MAHDSGYHLSQIIRALEESWPMLAYYLGIIGGAMIWATKMLIESRVTRAVHESEARVCEKIDEAEQRHTARYDRLEGLFLNHLETSERNKDSA